MLTRDGPGRLGVLPMPGTSLVLVPDHRTWARAAHAQGFGEGRVPRVEERWVEDAGPGSSNQAGTPGA